MDGPGAWQPLLNPAHIDVMSTILCEAVPARDAPVALERLHRTWAYNLALSAMIRVLSFDLGHTLLDEEAGRDVDIRFRPAIPMPGVLKVLPTITLPMAVWANTRDATAEDVKRWLDRATLGRYFRWIVTSSDIGYRKPDQRFFAAALGECECKANEVLFIGNQLNSDIKGANVCGIPSVLLTGPAYRSNDDSPDPTANPTYKIEQLEDLPNLLASLPSEIQPEI